MAVDFSQIRLVPADASHGEWLFQGRKQAFSELIQRVWGKWDEAFQRNIYAGEMAGLQPEVIYYQNHPAGCICMTRQAEWFDLQAFFLLPEYENLGIGTLVLKQKMDIADKAGIPVRLRHWNFNRAAHLYARMGFRETGREEFKETQDYLVLTERKPQKDTASMKYKAVIFDLFGTLIDNFTRKDYDSVMAKIAGILKAPPDDFIRIWKSSFNDRVTGVHGDQRETFGSICRELHILVTPEQIQRAFTVRMDFCRRTTIPRKGSVEVLIALRKGGLKTGLISDCTGEIPLVWDETPFAGLFDVTVFSCEAGMKKPDPRIYNLCCEGLGVKPEDCLYVGDGSSTELTGALKMSMQPVRIRDPKDLDEEHFMEREDDWPGPRISYLTEVLGLL